MTTFLITRHPATVDWLLHRNIEAELISHYDPDSDRIGRGDWVIGNLPIQLIADICSRDARYLHLEMEVPEEMRGKELTVNDMDRFQARLVEYSALYIGELCELQR